MNSGRTLKEPAVNIKPSLAQYVGRLEAYQATGSNKEIKACEKGDCLQPKRARRHGCSYMARSPLWIEVSCAKAVREDDGRGCGSAPPEHCGGLGLPEMNEKLKRNQADIGAWRKDGDGTKTRTRVLAFARPSGYFPRVGRAAAPRLIGAFVLRSHLPWRRCALDGPNTARTATCKRRAK